MRVLLTGGTGLVGSHTAEVLLGEGHEVRALVRPTSDAEHLRRLGAECVTGDLLDSPGRHAERARGCDALVHAAAAVFVPVDAGVFHAANVEGTLRTLRGAATAGVPRVLHVSSIAVYAGADGEQPLREDDWRRRDVPASAPYARSKRDAEEVAWRLHRERVFALTTVRPGVVYGERDRAVAPILGRISGWPIVPLPGGGRSTFPLVYAGNVARAIVRALELPEAAGRAYNLSADAPVTLRQAILWFAEALGRSPRVVAVPTLPLRAVAGAGELALRAIPGLTPRRLVRGLRRASSPNPYDDSRARDELGFGPTMPPEEALARTARWWASTSA